ncbi:MAG: PspC domain-containing protein [Prolixibacteraceae bacterium]|nr:PspC domain-containing protein [Prolixibacteraceae bacterium]
MKKTFTINISGTIFHIEEDAFEKLQRYFQNLKKHFGNNTEGQEIMDDIENRIAELFTEWSKGESKVITVDWVEQVIETMGTTEDFEQEDGESGHCVNSLSSKKRLYRNPDDRIIAGVCSGLSAYFNINPTIVRVIFVLLIFASCTGILVYIILWIAVPRAATTAQRLEMRGEEVNVNNIQRTVRDQNSEENILDSDKKKIPADITPDIPNETNEENAFGADTGKIKEEGLEREDTGEITPWEKPATENPKPTTYDKKYYSQSSSRPAAKKERDLSSNIGKAVLRVFSIVIGAFLLITGFLGLVTTISTFVFGQQLLTDNSWYLGTDLPFGGLVSNFISDDSITPGVISLLLFVGIPFAALFFIGAKMIFRFKSNNVAVGLGMVGLWFVAMIVFFFVSVGQVGNYKQQATLTNSETVLCNSCKTLYLEANPDAYDEYPYIDLNNSRSKIVRTGNENVVLGKPRINVKKSESDNIVILFKKRSRGNNMDDANRYIKEMEYSYQITDSLIHFDAYFQAGRRNKWRHQQMEITLKIPVGIGVYLGESMKEIIHDIDNVTNTWDRDMVGKYWEMRPEGLTIVQPDKAIEPAETENNGAADTVE